MNEPGPDPRAQLAMARPVLCTGSVWETIRTLVMARQRGRRDERGRWGWRSPEIGHRNEAGAVCWEGFLEAAVLDLSSDTEDRGGEGFVDHHSSPGKGAGEFRRGLF